MELTPSSEIQWTCMRYFFCRTFSFPRLFFYKWGSIEDWWDWRGWKQKGDNFYVEIVVYSIHFETTQDIILSSSFHSMQYFLHSPKSSAYFSLSKFYLSYLFDLLHTQLLEHLTLHFILGVNLVGLAEIMNVKMFKTLKFFISMNSFLFTRTDIVRKKWSHLGFKISDSMPSWVLHTQVDGTGSSLMKHLIENIINIVSILYNEEEIKNQQSSNRIVIILY